MKVWELVDKLQQMDQDAEVETYKGHDPEYGEEYDTLFEVTQEPTGWDDYNDSAIFTVFIK